VTEPVGFTRLSVDISQDNSEALDSVCQREGVAVTTATRLLLRLGYVVYHAINVEGHDVLIDDGKQPQPIELDQ
jgi:hypothetical protein